MAAAKRRKRGRPKGDYKLPPVIAGLYWDIQDLTDELGAYGIEADNKLLGVLLEHQSKNGAELFFRYTQTAEQLRQLLQKVYKRKKDHAALEEFDALVLKHMLGELKTEEQ